jgi:hypothetical protein
MTIDFDYEDLLHNSFETIKPIIYKAMKRYVIPSWSRDEYIQEGYILLDDILQEYETIDTNQLCTFFKVRYTQLLLTTIRRQRADKRGYHHLKYSDLSEIADLIADNHQNVAESVLLETSLVEFKMHAASARDIEILTKLERGERTRPHERYQIRRHLADFIGFDPTKKSR